MTGPVRIVRCANQECPLFGEHRVVPFTTVGPELWGIPSVVCSCGSTARVLDRWTHPAPERAVASAPERRGKKR